MSDTKDIVVNDGSLGQVLMGMDPGRMCEMLPTIFKGLDPEEPAYFELISKKIKEPKVTLQGIGKRMLKVKFRMWMWDIPCGTYSFEVPALENETPTEGGVQ